MRMPKEERTNQSPFFNQIVQSIPGRPEAIPVQDGTDISAITEGDQSRTIPWLHGAAGPPVEVLLVPRHVVIVLPGLGDHGHHSLGQGSKCFFYLHFAFWHIFALL